MRPLPFPPAHVARARRFQMRRHGLALANTLMSAGLVAAFLCLAPRGRWPLPGGGRLLAGWLYFGLLAIAREAVLLPVEYLSGFSLPQRVGLSNQTLSRWAGDRAKSLALTLLLGGGAAGVFLEVTAARPSGWWWIAGGMGAGLGVLLTLVGPVLLAPLFFRFRPLADGELRARLESLLRRTGARVRGGVWEMDLSRRTKGANAGLVGWGPSRRVVLSDTLVQEYAPEEIEAVLAHEIGHHQGRHIPRMMAVQGTALMLGLYLAEALLAWPPAYAWTGLPSPAAGEPSLIPAVWLFLMLWGMLLAPGVRAYSRRLERECDDFAVRHGQGGGGLASALTDLCRKNLADPDPPRWVLWFFHSHPAPLERIRRAQEAESQRENLPGGEVQ